MRFAGLLLTALVALEHAWFAVLEIWLYRGRIGRETFRITQEVADASAPLAANVGFYNACIAVGLVLSLVGPTAWRWPLQAILLSFALLAGCFGGITLGVATFLFQGLPALLALGLLLAARR